MEESGTIIISTSVELLSQLEADPPAGLQALAQSAGVSGKPFRRLSIDQVERHGDYVKLSYDCSEGVNVSIAFVSKGSGIEYYARHSDEYGTYSFYALTASGIKHGFQIDAGGDAMEYDDYVDEIAGKLDAWKQAIPDAVKQVFPDFADADMGDYCF